MFPAMAGRFFTPSTTWEAPTIVSSQTKLNLSFHKTLVLPFPQFWSCGLKSSFIVLEFKKELSSVKDTISIQTVTEMPPFSVSVSQYFFSLPLKFTALVSNRSFHKSLAGVILCIKSCLYVCSVAQSCQLFCDPMDCSPTDSYVHRISQARILEWVAISFSRGSSRPRNRTHISCIAGQILYQLIHLGSSQVMSREFLLCAYHQGLLPRPDCYTFPFPLYTFPSENKVLYISTLEISLHSFIIIFS